MTTRRIQTVPYSTQVRQGDLSKQDSKNIYINAIQYSKDASTYSQHILNTGHPCWNKQNIIEIIQITQKGRHMNSLEKFYIYYAHQENKQMKYFFISKILHLIYMIIVQNNHTKPHRTSRQQHYTHHHIKLSGIKPVSTRPTQPLLQASQSPHKIRKHSVHIKKFQNSTYYTSLC
jgi:hypothetical protein